MNLRDLRRSALLAGAFALTASPAFAQTAGGDLGGFIQQLIDLSCRARPTADQPHQVLVLLDEFARLGHAEVVAKAFAYVAGYGLRLLPVLQSPAQLRGEYGLELAEEIAANCAVEVVFAPKELKLANELSDRLGQTTVRAASRNRPSGLSGGHRSVSESDQRRALRLPQELMQMPLDELIVLKAGLAPIRGRKIRYFAERALASRVRPPPRVIPCPPAPDAVAPVATPADPLTLEGIAGKLAEAGLEPLPADDASVAEVEAWVDRYLDTALGAPDPEELPHARQLEQTRT